MGRMDGRIAFVTGAARGQEMIDVNLSGVCKTVKAGVPHILQGDRGGSIVLTSSVAGNKAYPHVGHYVAAKHGVIGLMRSFAVELGQRMIRVNAVLPTHVDSPLLMNEATYRALRPELEARTSPVSRCRWMPAPA